MDPKKKLLLKLVEARARRAISNLAAELSRPSADQKEAIQAGLDFERWLADSCRACRKGCQIGSQGHP